MSIIRDIFGAPPFGLLLEHTRKVHECVKLIRPLMDACIREDYEEVHRLQDTVSKLEHEADRIKHEIRDHLIKRYFLPVAREDLERFLHYQDSVADGVQDFAVILLIRRTKVHTKLAKEFLDFADQTITVCNTLMSAAQEMQNLAETSFGGAEARTVLERIAGVGEAEWQADRMQRRISIHIYEIEGELDPITILFYEKMLHALSDVANAAENTGDWLRTMIVKNA